MNNGNLLNNLLGITGAQPAAAKSSAAKARAESGAKFQQALEQVRPDVAARKPVARKEVPAKAANEERPTAKPIVQREPKQEIKRADAPAKPREDAQNVTTKTPEKNDTAASATGAGEPVVASSNQRQAGSAPNQGVAGESGGAEGQAPELSESPILVPEDVLLANLAADSAPALPETLAGSAAAIAQPVVVGEPANEDEIDLSETPEAAVVLDPILVGIKAPVVPEAADLVVDTEGANPSPLLASNQDGLEQASAVVGIAGATGASSPGVLATLPGQAVDNLLAGTKVGASAEAEVGASVETEALPSGDGENPDFLLLNSKAALNKLAETTMASAPLDKAAPSADLAKPAVVSAAVETLARLAEPQSPAARAFVVQTGVPVPVGSPQWSQAMGDKVLWLAAQNVSAAEIRLDPPELGPMQIKVSVNQDQASVTFTSPHPVVREALDQQLNRLREMFSEQGLNLVNVDVSDKPFTQQEQEEQAKRQANADSDEEELTPVAVTQAIAMRLVDHYA